MLNNVIAVIRGAYERTEMLATRVVEEQVVANNIFVIHERPFTAALRRSYEIGIDNSLEWTLCIDADVLVKEDAIIELLEFAHTLPKDTLGCSGLVHYKFRGSADWGGLHLYRTSLLPKAYSLISDTSLDLRPETYVKTEMEKLGHKWVITDKILGLHDFEQYYTDIFRKLLVRSIKSPHQAQGLLRRALVLSKVDSDFLVALWGIRVGMGFSGRVDLDAKQWETEAKALLLANDMQEKEPLQIDDSIGLIQKYFANFSPQWGEFPFSEGQDVSRGQNSFYASIWRIGWQISQFGFRLQNASIRRMQK